MPGIAPVKQKVLDAFEARKDNWSAYDFESALEQAMGARYGNYQTAKLTILEADAHGRWPKTVRRYLASLYRGFGNLPIELVDIGTRLGIGSNASEFEQLVRDILVGNLWTLVDDGDNRGFDFLAHAKESTSRWRGLTYAVETKYYRTARAQGLLLQTAARRLKEHARQAGIDQALLVVSCQVPITLHAALELEFDIGVIGRAELLHMATNTPGLLDKLNSLVESRPDINAPTAVATDDTVADVPPALPVLPGAAPPPDTQGTELCQELKALPRGRKTWKAYEDLCDRVLRYLFPSDLVGWHRQKWTDDGLHRFDYVCRIRPATEFWQFLLQHLNSRYILFEFKNHSDTITQGEVLTTEKYLLERGLRRVAIILTRAGADENALKMAQGAMREQGKLMLILDDQQVCDLLHRKEAGEDPTDRLFDLADNFLLSLPR